ncbi:MAG: imidazole glycerol phosphate synthase subunit HisH [Candidatus Aureabacteria bacterium]|nr:imidazole glycerol phosphate synthase subunit HisH [Candidatus Auribacterota bacterium]
MLALIDYGMGNIKSVYKAFEFVKAPVTLVENKDQFDAMDNVKGIILPGVGAFGDCMKNLDSRGFISVIKENIDKKMPYLGICLGFQILFGSSEESPGISGLEIFKGTNRRFSEELKVPHMGWNRIIKVNDNVFLNNIADKRHFYFVHSYYVDNDDKMIISTVTDYGISFTSSICKDKLFACQFHPEKSQDGGLNIIRNFVSQCL